MKKGKTLPELAVELQRQKDAMRDFRAPASRLLVSPEGTLSIPLGSTATKHTVGITGIFHRQLAAWTGIPQKYYDRMLVETRSLWADNVNCWLGRSADVRLVRTLDDTARAFLSHRYRTLDNVDVVASILPVFQERRIETVSTEITPEHLWLKGVNARSTLEVKKGDPIQVGVVISNSEVGLGAVHVDPFIYRLVCTNGAIVADAGLRKFHIGRQIQALDETVLEVFTNETILADNRAFFLKLRDVVTAALDETQMTDLLQSIAAGTQRPLGEGRFLEEVVEVTAGRFGLTGVESEGVLRALIDGKDLTQWGLANAVTTHASQVPGYERATALERIGGTLMTLPEKEWKELAA